MLKKLLAAMISIVLLFSAVSCGNKTNNTGSKIKNVILLIGDGMGPNQIKFGELHKGEPLFVQSLTQTTTVETRSASDLVTDSAAAATAMSTGTRITNGNVGINAYGEELETVVDYAKSLGKRTGILTTEELYGATPMGFSAHSYSRSNIDELMRSAAETSNVDLFASFMFPASYSHMLYYFTDNNYEWITDVDEISDSTYEKIIGSFNIVAGTPSMNADEFSIAFDRLVVESLDYLSKDKDGFFLMAEGAHIDHGGHNNDIEYMVRELLAFDEAVEAAVNWASKRNDTLVIVTADHETGGLMLSRGITHENLYDADAGGFLNFMWTTTGHTSTNVNLYAYGATVDFEKYSSFGAGTLIQNVDITKIIRDYLGK